LEDYVKKIGVLFGMENTFPGALVDRINAMEIDGIQAEFVHVGGVRMAEPSGYAVIVDRISHDMPFYRSFLKNAVLTGTQVINNPFWWSADDKFFNFALATKQGVAIPKTVLLPHKKFPPQITERSLRNLQFPLDWDSIFDYVGFPAFLKPHDGGGWRDVYHVHNREEFFHAYDKTTGKLLWETELPFSGLATPATYMVNGKQYVVIAAGGGQSSRKPSGGVYVAFALPN